MRKVNSYVELNVKITTDQFCTNLSETYSIHIHRTVDKDDELGTYLLNEDDTSTDQWRFVLISLTLS